MIVERGLAGFALPFATGVGIAVYFGNISLEASVLLASISFFLCIGTTVAMVYSVVALRQTNGYAGSRYIHIFDYISDNYRNIPIILAGLSTGLMFGFSSASLAVSEISWGIGELAKEAGAKLSAITDRIPFESTDTNALVKALLTGDRSGLSSHTKEIFRLSGASHILALSGLHLGIIYGLVSKILGLIGNSRKAKVLSSMLLILTCGGYAMITGAGASICRAFIFIFLRECAKITFRSTDLKNILAASLLIHLVTSPESITSVGFQLSYAAMFGIAYIYPWFKDFWPDEKTHEFGLLHKIWDIAALSVACQLTAGSIAWIYFGSFPKYFILTNIIAMPLSGILIPLALITLLLESLGICPGLLVLATEKIADTMTYILNIISTL